MKKHFKFLAGKGSHVASLGIASLAGGLISAVALAAIPDNSGVIHGCYNNKTGVLSVIDTNNGGTCTNKETALSWNQTGPQDPAGSSGGVELKDANGQVLGDIVGFSSNYISDSGSKMNVFNPTLNRILPLTYDNASGVVRLGELAAPIFESSSCTGQAYVVAENSLSMPIFTELFRWNDGSIEFHALINTSASTATITDNSSLQFNGTNYFCQTDSGSTYNAYPFTTVSLPFSSPVTAPFKL